MICKNCKAEIIKSDICGDKCVYCIGVMEPYKESFLTCFYCGKEYKSLVNNLCKECTKKWVNLSNDERDNVIRNSWNRKVLL